MYRKVCVEAAEAAQKQRWTCPLWLKSWWGIVSAMPRCVLCGSYPPPCPLPPLPPAAAAAIPRRTADTAAPGFCSSRHTGSLPGQCVRPPSGQRAREAEKRSCRSLRHIHLHCVQHAFTFKHMASTLSDDLKKRKKKKKVLSVCSSRLFSDLGFKCLMKYSTSTFPIS